MLARPVPLDPEIVKRYGEIPGGAVMVVNPASRKNLTRLNRTKAWFNRIIARHPLRGCRASRSRRGAQRGDGDRSHAGNPNADRVHPGPASVSRHLASAAERASPLSGAPPRGALVDVRASSPLIARALRRLAKLGE